MTAAKSASDLTALNALGRQGFADALEDIYEHSPWIPARAHAAAPFADLDALLEALREVVDAASEEEQLALIRAHPDLAGKAALAGDLTAHSSQEQAGAGLGQLSAEEYARFQRLNDAYRAKFGFPFILAVKGHDKTSILQAFETRLPNDPDTEQERALEQIHRIARLRLEALLGTA